MRHSTKRSLLGTATLRAPCSFDDQTCCPAARRCRQAPVLPGESRPPSLQDHAHSVRGMPTPQLSSMAQGQVWQAHSARGQLLQQAKPFGESV